MKKQDGDRNTAVLMGVAAILISNSHLESLYPKPWMAADGLLGNTLFFVMAGYGIILSQSLRPDGFGAFVAKRILRIYPTFWLAMLIAALVGSLATFGLDGVSWFTAYIWPTSFKFIGIILLMYPILWLLARGASKHYAATLCAALAIFTGLWAKLLFSPSSENLSLGQLPESLWWSFYASATLAGGWVAVPRAVKLPASPSVWPALARLFIAYVVLKFELSLRILTNPQQVPSILLAGPLLLLAAGWSLLCLRGVDTINTVFQRIHLAAPIAWIGKASLQIYVLHQSVYFLVRPTSLAWPIKLVIFALCTVIAAHGLLWLVVTGQRLLFKPKQSTPHAS